MRWLWSGRGTLPGKLPYFFPARRNGSISSSGAAVLLTELLSRYGDVVCRKLILIIGWFNLLARFLNGCRVPMENFEKLNKRIDPLA